MKRTTSKYCYKKQALFLFFGLVFLLGSAFTAAAVTENSTATIYKVKTTIDSLTVKNDQNYFYNADILFESYVEALNPAQGEQHNMTTEAISIGSKESQAVQPPAVIYENEQCGCDQSFDIKLFLYDYSPAEKALSGLVIKGLNLGLSWLTGGVVGVGANLLGELVDFLMDWFMTQGLPPDQAQALVQDQLRQLSNLFGIAEGKIDTGCEVKALSLPIISAGENNGEVNLTITKTDTGLPCSEEATDAAPENPPEDLPPSEPSDGPTDQPPGDEDEEPEEDKPDCLPDTGKVLINNEYHCPISAVPAGQGCACKPGYEWAYPNDLCQGCTKTKSDDCLAAVKQSVDMGAGYISPQVITIGNQMKWSTGAMACKSLDSDLQHWNDAFSTVTPMNTALCTNLIFLGGQINNAPSAPNCNIDFYWQFKK